MKIVFIGCVESSYVLLDELLKNKYEISGIVTMNQSAINADFKSLEPLAKKHGVQCLCTKDVNDNDTYDFIQSVNPDVIYCFGWSRLIGERLLKLPKLGVVGFHPAELPYNRGRHPLIWALALGLEKTASSFFMMNEGADTGDIISQEIIDICYEDTAQILYEKVLDVAKRQIVNFTDAFIQGTIIRSPQLVDTGNVWRKRGKADGKIDWRMSSRGIYNLVRALTHPYVGAHFEHQGKDIKVWRCEEIAGNDFVNLEPGKIIKVNSDIDYYVKTNEGVIHILDSDPVQLAEGEYL